jgi:hypothetical protein
MNSISQSHTGANEQLVARLESSFFIAKTRRAAIILLRDASA